jgi:hypothetical protein
MNPQYYWTFYNVISFSADAKLVLSTYYGVGNNKVDIDMYTYMDGGMQSTLSVTKDGCVPHDIYTRLDILLTNK